MAKKLMKRDLIMLVIREIPTSYHSTSTRRLKSKRLKMPSAGKDVVKLESSYTAGGSVNHYGHVSIQCHRFDNSISRNTPNKNGYTGLPRDGHENDHSRLWNGPK